MAEETEKPTSETPASAPAALPTVEAPSISPAEPAQPAPALEALAAPSTAELVKSSPFAAITPKTMVLAASIVLAAALGGVFGALATGVTPKDATAEHERQAMQQSLARLTKDIAALKTELAAADKTAKAQTARVTDLDTKLREHLVRDQAAITGSIAAPASAPPITAPAAVPPATTASLPLPQPRPAVHEASARDGVAEGWTVLGARRGFVYVQSGREVYRVAPGARLPGLGIVEEIRREDGEWIVVTRRGVIVATRDRF